MIGYLLDANESETNELIDHLCKNGYRSIVYKDEDYILYVADEERYEVETILDDREIFYVANDFSKTIDITKEDVRCIDLMFEDKGISSTYELWFDVDKYFGWKTAELDCVWINFYTEWFPNGSIKASYSLDGDIYYHREWKLTEEETAFFKKKMEEYCQQSVGKSLMDFWIEHNEREVV